MLEQKQKYIPVDMKDLPDGGEQWFQIVILRDDQIDKIADAVIERVRDRTPE